MMTTLRRLQSSPRHSTLRRQLQYSPHHFPPRCSTLRSLQCPPRRSTPRRPQCSPHSFSSSVMATPRQGLTDVTHPVIEPRHAFWTLVTSVECHPVTERAISVKPIARHIVYPGHAFGNLVLWILWHPMTWHTQHLPGPTPRRYG
jgi:hypothetical protein